MINDNETADDITLNAPGATLQIDGGSNGDGNSGQLYLNANYADNTLVVEAGTLSLINGAFLGSGTVVAAPGSITFDRSPNTLDAINVDGGLEVVDGDVVLQDGTTVYADATQTALGAIAVVTDANNAPGANLAQITFNTTNYFLEQTLLLSDGVVTASDPTNSGVEQFTVDTEGSIAGWARSRMPTSAIPPSI